MLGNLNKAETSSLYNILSYLLDIS